MAIVVIAGCSAPKPHPLPDDLEKLFPTIERLGVLSFEHRVYNEGEPVCDALSYRRGFFASTETNQCGVFEASSPTVPFDPEGAADLALVKAELDRLRLPIEWLVTKPGRNGTPGPDSAFMLNGCIQYVFHPGWTALPESHPGKEVSTGVNANWYLTDICP